MRLGYVCRVGGRFGWGHLHRGVALLERLDSRSELVVGDGFQEAATSKPGFSIRPWRSPEEPVDPAAFDVVIVDDYELSIDWLAHAADTIPTYVVDDWMRSTARVTGFINPNIGAVRSDYDAIAAEEWLLGSKFAFMRREVRDLAASSRIRPFSSHVLVTLGGSDPDGRTAEVVDELCATAWYRRGGRLSVVLGASYNARIPVSQGVADRFEIVRNPPDYLERCREADLVICSASTVSYEMALLGVPFVPLSFVDNQRRIGERWRQAGVGGGFDICNVGWAYALVEYVTDAIASPTRLASMSALSRQFVDGEGTSRVVSSCREMAQR